MRFCTTLKTVPTKCTPNELFFSRQWLASTSEELDTQIQKYWRLDTCKCVVISREKWTRRQGSWRLVHIKLIV